MTEDRVTAALKTVIDPELGINVVDLGLVYAVRREGDKLVVELGTTSPACPLGGHLRDGARRALLGVVDGVADVEVRLVPDRPWSRDRMTDEGRRQLQGGPIPAPAAPVGIGRGRLQVLPSAPPSTSLAAPAAHAPSTLAVQRIPILAIAVASLVLALLGGIVRLGWGITWEVPLAPTSAIVHHGPMMVLGFLGTLIGVERAVALERPWAWGAPIGMAIGAIAIILGKLELAHWAAMGGSLLFVAVSIEIVRLQRALHNVTMAFGAAALAGSVLAWMAGTPVFGLIPWWAAYLVLTIAGERLELSRFASSIELSPVGFAVPMGALVVAALLAPLDLELSSRILGAGLIGLAVWLGLFDLARRTIRSTGLTRFVAAALLSGYAWLAVAGWLWLTRGALYAGPAYDAPLHALMVGFVFSMIFAHAPIVFPAVLKTSLPWTPWLYAPLALLHGSLLLRVWADLANAHTPRAIAGLLGMLTILAFFATLAVGKGLAERGERR
jgi:metal-sulfur cluster biosynthetic enzyme